jgi:branched-chain amino acid transport system permease protein
MTSLSLSNIIVLGYNSLSYAALLFLLASGLSLIFGVMRIVNLAHASFFLLAGYVALESYNIFSGSLSVLPRVIQIAAWVAVFFAWKGLARLTGGWMSMAIVFGVYVTAEVVTSILWGYPVVGIFFPKIPLEPVTDINLPMLLAAIAVAVAVIGLGGMFVERFFLRALGQDEVAQVLVTIGFAFILQDGSLYTWGGDAYNVNQPWPFDFSYVVSGMYFPMYRGLMILVAVIVALIMYFAIERTRFGAIMRATVDDPQMAQGIGINTNVVSMSIFFGIYPGLDFEILPYAFAVVIIGGMGTMTGVIVGSLMVGFIENFGTALFPELSYFALFAPMAIILAIKPTGLFGRG